MIQKVLLILAEKLALKGGEWLVRKLNQQDPPKPSEETHPLAYKDVEHIRAQERASIDASKQYYAERASVSAKPQPDEEDWRDEPTVPGIPSKRPPQR